MYPDRFETRLARVRHRFAITLESKIEDAVISANIMSRGNDSLIKHLSDSYRTHRRRDLDAGVSRRPPVN